MPSFAITFGTPNEHSGTCNHAEVPLMVNGIERKKRHVSLASLRQDPTNAEVADAAEVLLREAIARSDPQTKAEARTTLSTVSVTVSW